MEAKWRKRGRVKRAESTHKEERDREKRRKRKGEER
jgi:hypothetical protein